MAVSSAYRWIESVFGGAACITTVANGSSASVLQAFGADLSTLVEGDERYSHSGRYDAVVSVYTVPGGAIAYEANGFHGSLREVVSQLAESGARVTSMYWNNDWTMPRLTCADGKFVSSTTLFDFGDEDWCPDYDDELPADLDGLADELRSVNFDADDSNMQMLAIGFAMMEQFCGVATPRDLFDEPEPPSHPIRG